MKCADCGEEIKDFKMTRPSWLTWMRSEEVLVEHTPQEIIEIDEDGVVTVVESAHQSNRLRPWLLRKLAKVIETTRAYAANEGQRL